jgi:hypothetical protein
MATTVNAKEASEMLERAKAAQTRRRAINDMQVGGNIVLPLRETVKTYAPECIGKNRKYREFFGHATETDKYLEKGYEPVISNGVHVGCEGLLLYRLPLDIWQDNETAKKIRSDRMLSEAKAESPEVTEANKTAQKSGSKMATEEFEIIKPSSPKYSRVEVGKDG